MHRTITRALGALFLLGLALGPVRAATTQQDALFKVIGPYLWTYAFSDYLEARVSAGFAVAQLNTGAVKTTPLTTGTVTFAATQTLALIVPAGTIAALTLTLPACAPANDGDERAYVSSQIITTLTVGASAGSVVGATASAAVGIGHKFHCYGADTVWYQS